MLDIQNGLYDCGPPLLYPQFDVRYTLANIFLVPPASKDMLNCFSWIRIAVAKRWVILLNSKRIITVRYMSSELPPTRFRNESEAPPSFRWGLPSSLPFRYWFGMFSSFYFCTYRIDSALLLVKSWYFVRQDVNRNYTCYNTSYIVGHCSITVAHFQCTLAVDWLIFSKKDLVLSACDYTRDA